MNLKRVVTHIACGLLFASCGAYFNQPVVNEQARIGETSGFSTKLVEFPEPAEPIVAGVYNFKDQTGQYKNVENGSTFSTAVSQGATTMLIKALEDSKWFTPIERENLGNLLNERNIIRSTRDEYRKNSNPNEPNLPPLLYAGVLLEGGIISYDSNIITGGLGARYFGVGGSTQYRQDRITVYLRAVSTSSGKILKTVYISKTILSQAIDASLFRYVNFQRLLEVETGYTKNEPVQLAMKEAIEKAVHALIIEGIKDRLWSTKSGNDLNDKLVQEYLEEKKQEESTRLYEREFFDQTFKNAMSIDLGGALYKGDYGAGNFAPLIRLGYNTSLTDFMSLGLKGGLFKLESESSFEDTFGHLDLNLEFNLLKNDRFAPFVYAGGGIIIGFGDGANLGLDEEQTDGKFQYGFGINYNVSPKISLRLWGEHNIPFTDLIDGVESGKYTDFYYNFGLGLQYHFNFSSKSKTTDKPLENNGDEN